MNHQIGVMTAMLTQEKDVQIVDIHTIAEASTHGQK